MKLPSNASKARSGTVRKSNRTDAESAKMATSKGVIQGYTGVPVVRAMRDVLAPDSLISADAGYHSEANLKQLGEMQITALIADNGMRKRDERFATQARHQTRPDPLYDKSPAAKPAKLYTPKDFAYDPVRQTCVCPAGKGFFYSLNGLRIPRCTAPTWA